MITAGFTLIDRGSWTSGFNYLRMTSEVMRSRLAGKLRMRVIISQEEWVSRREEIAAAFPADEIVVDDRIKNAGRGIRLAEALITGRDARAETAFRTAGCDAVFENAAFFGKRFGLPVVAWLPDFQHLALPHLFSRAGWWRREIGFRLQTSNRQIIMLSSESARADCEHTYPASRDRIEVVRFAVPMDIGKTRSLIDGIRSNYRLPARFIYLPNQFFAHKNHSLVIEALELASHEGVLSRTLPIIATGNSHDPRDPSYYKRLQERITASGVASHFTHLGLVPFPHVLALSAGAEAILNPSLFEGWSTPIEEAKTLGTPLVLSDLPVLREQAPDALFFAPNSARSCLDALLEVSAHSARVAEPVEMLEAKQSDRVDAHARALFRTFERAVF